jgi:NAD(P)-dependent dehydrogenase (short-subunit alcohol dehydrogenase family)
MSRRNRFEDKAGIVTGAGAGLGRDTALALSEEGAAVLALDRDRDAVERTAELARSNLGTVLALEGDVSHERDVIDAIALCRSELGRVAFLHNNAAIQIEASLQETTNDQWDAVMSVNLKSVFWGCKHAVTAMRESGGGAIVNTSSLLAITADPLLTAYSSSKTAVLGLTRAVALGYAADGIRCNAICPGDMDTAMVQRYLDATPDPEATRRQIQNAYPAKRISHPREVARAVAFLLSDEASFINGASLIIDGGVSLRTY